LGFKLHQNAFGGRALPGPAGGAKALPSPVAVITGMGREIEGREENGMEGKGGVGGGEMGMVRGGKWARAGAGKG